MKDFVGVFRSTTTRNKKNSKSHTYKLMINEHFFLYLPISSNSFIYKEKFDHFIVPFSISVRVESGQMVEAYASVAVRRK